MSAQRDNTLGRLGGYVFSELDRLDAMETSDADAHGPAIHRIKGNTACHRKVIREWFRDYCGKEVTFT